MSKPENNKLSRASFEDSPSFLLSTLGNRITLIAERNIRKHLDLSYMQWRVVQIVGSEPGTIPNRIASFTGVNKANVSRAVNSLEQRELLYRTSIANNSRHTQLHLTKAGKEVFKKGNTMRVNSEEEFLSGINSSSRVELNKLLIQLLQNIKSID